jgi:hypothetical protein
MKQIYLTLAVGCFAFGTMAQSIQKQKEIAVIKTAKSPVQNQNKVDLWTNDFSTAGDWAFQDLAGSGDNWVIGTAVPSGTFAIDPIASTSAANGYALFDSDLLCSGDQNALVKNANPINLTGEPNVTLEFESYYREFQGSAFVGFSTDGTTWTYVAVHTDLGANDACANPTTVSVPAPVIGGSSTAYICFRYQGGCDYAWMVDDVKLVRTPDNDLKTTFQNWGSNGYQYSQIPLTQIQPTEFQVGVINNGINNLTNIGLTVNVTGQETTSVSATPVATSVTGQIDTLVATYTPSAIGTYNFTQALSLTETDENPANNSGLPNRSFAVTNYTYAVDKGTPFSTYPDLEDIFLDATIPYTEIGNSYDIAVTQDIYGIDVYIDTATANGSSFYGTLYSYNTAATSGSDLWTAIVETDPLIVDASTPKASIVSLLFPSEVSLAPGTYMVSVRESDDGVVFGGSGATSGSTQSWCWITNASSTSAWTGLSLVPIVRMNFDPSLSVKTVANLEGVKVYPNPTKGLVNISNDNNLDNTITVTDINGKVIATKSSSVATTIDLNTSNAGIYFVEVKNQNGKKVEKIIVE